MGRASNSMMAGARRNPHEAAAILVERARAGDQSAFSELVRRYRSRIYALCLHLTRSESDADDITQEVFLGAFRSLQSFAGRSEFFTWVYRMAVNRSLSARRSRDRRGETPIDDPRLEKAVAVDAAGDPARATELRSTYSRLLAALDRLPAEMRTTVVLVSLQGFSHGEAAVVQGCPEGTIAWRMHAARGQLRKALKVQVPPKTRAHATRPDLSRELRQLLGEAGLPILAVF